MAPSAVFGTNSASSEKDESRGLWTIAVAVVVGLGIIANALIRPDEGPFQARAWEVCEGYVVENLVLPAGARFPDLPENPSERVKLQLGSNRYVVFSYYESPDTARRDFMCIVGYLGDDHYQVIDLVTES